MKTQNYSASSFFKVSALVASLALIGAATSGCSGAHSESAESVERLSAVEATAVSRSDVSSRYTAGSTLTARETATVVARSQGVVSEVLVEEGDRVAAGQLLARVDDERLRLEIRRIEAGVTRLGAELARSQSMLDRGMTSTEEHERLRFEHQAEQAALNLAKLESEHSAIRAPFDGVITLRHARRGQLLKVHAAAFEMANFDHLQARFDVPEAVAVKITAGAPVTLTLDALSGRSVAAHVARVSPEVDSATGTVAVTVDVDGKDEMLRPGMFVRTWMALDTVADAMVIPRRALINERGRSLVFVVEDGQVYRREVHLGIEQDESVEVLSGIDASAMVVITGQSTLRDGESVDVIGAAG